MFLVNRLPVENQYVTAREAEVLWHCANGLTNSQIAQKMFISLNTVERHRENIRKRFWLMGYHAFTQFAFKARPELEKWVK